jgi:hypothetical protein
LEWATPAAFVAAVAAPNRRVVLITGEGSHQLTAQELSQFGRRGLKSAVFVLNNSGYLIERLPCKNPISCPTISLNGTTLDYRKWLRRLVYRACDNLWEFDQPLKQRLRATEELTSRCQRQVCCFTDGRKASRKCEDSLLGRNESSRRNTSNSKHS